MNNLFLSEKAKNDLLETKTYIEEELQNPASAKETVNNIIKSLRILQDFAQAGALLSSVVNIESDYRFLVSGNYISFYRIHNNEIYVDRILYARRNYMQILFGDDEK
jgi:toxin ParE1/3/4